MRCCGCCNCFWLLRNRFHLWIRDYDNLQSFAILLLYFQIGCALIGSVLGAQYTGVLLVNLVISLFALVAIESSSQNLGRTYAGLLSASILVDVFWFVLFAHYIWNLSSSGDDDVKFVFSVKLVLVMQIIGFSVRLSSSLLWIQMYRLGASYIDNAASSQYADYDMRNSFFSPVIPACTTNAMASGTGDALGGSIYDPAYYSSLFEESHENNQVDSPLLHHDKDTWNVGSPVSGTSLLKHSTGQSFIIDDKPASMDHII